IRRPRSAARGVARPPRSQDSGSSRSRTRARPRSGDAAVRPATLRSTRVVRTVTLRYSSPRSSFARGSIVTAKPRATPAEPPASGGAKARRASVAWLVWAVTLLAAGIVADPRTWGVHALAFLPRPAWFATLALVAALLRRDVALRFG